MGPEETQPCPVWQLPQGDHYSFLRGVRVNPLRRVERLLPLGGEAFSTGKEDSLAFKGSTSPPSPGSSHMSPLQLIGSQSFPKQHPHYNKRHPTESGSLSRAVI